MLPTSHIVKGDASPFFHILAMNSETALLHNAQVDKNGGPNFLKAWREHREMSQEQLAEKVGTTASVISMLEAGERGLSAKWLRKPAPALKTTPGHLLEHDPQELPTDVLDIWAAIDKRDRATAIRVLESFNRTGTHDR
jgi:transcriptional regulator with XRE-family HTH domain